MTFWNCCAIPDNDLSDYIILKLDFSHKHLADVPFAVFENERTLEELHMSCNKILDLPKQLFFCQELKELHLKNNKIEILPPAIGQLHNLEKLDISKNCLANIPESLKSCKKLQFLDIGDNAFEKLPDVITKLIHLEELYLNDSYLDFLPARFGGLTNLRILEVRHNKLITLPKSMARLTSLTRIDIGSNDFRELPEVIGCMINLKELLIDGNKISRISANIKNLKKLIHFEAGDNRLRSLPQEISNWTNVEVICLTKNDLENLPEAFGEMKSLVSLKLDDNELQELPSCIGNLTNLEEIMLSHNDLYCLPSSIGFLRKLKIFTCDENTLRELPDEISSCVSLKILSVRGNKLTVLPSNIGHLNNLTVMNIVNNFITHLPVSMWNLKLSALWISENQSKPLIPLQKEYSGGENYHLTCYMLPQEVYKKEHSTLQKYHPPPTTTTKHICFASDSIKPRDESFGLLRSPTPYPKELKTMASCARRLPVNNIEQPNPTIKEAKINNTIVLNYEDIDDHKTKLLSSPIPPPLPIRNYIWNEQSDYTDSRQIINEYINLPIQNFKSSQSSHINEFNDQIDYNWIEPNIELPQIIPQQQPPPYHIAKAYTKKSKQDLLIYDSIRKSIRDDENNSVLSSSPMPSQIKNSSQLSVNVDSTIEFYDNSENNNLSVKLDDDEELMTEDEDVDTLIKLLEENSEKPVCSPVQSEGNSKPFRQQWMFGQHRNPTVMQFSILKNPDIGFQVKQSPINGVFVSEIDEHSNAAYFLKVQDKLLDVDGQNLTKSSVKEAKLALSNSGPTMNIMISRI